MKRSPAKPKPDRLLLLTDRIDRLAASAGRNSRRGRCHVLPNATLRWRVRCLMHGLRPPHPNPPPHLAKYLSNDRLGSRFRLADVLLRHSGLGDQLLGLTHHLVAQLVAIAAPGHPGGFADLPGFRARVIDAGGQ